MLDGQQRLTSLYQAIFGVGQSRFFLDIGALISGSDIGDAVRVFNAERAAPFVTLQAQADALMMPLAAVRDGGAARWRDDSIDSRKDEDPTRARDLLRNIERAYIDPLVQYAFPVTVLPQRTELEAVCTIFETLNRTGKPPTPFELIRARAFAGGLSLYDYWCSALERHPILEDFEAGPEQGAMRAKLERWFWCACFTGEYESSSASLTERDAPVLKAWLTGETEPPVVCDFEWDPERWRSVTIRQQGLYRATIALTLAQRPRDFHTAAPLTRELIEAGRVDDHHVFPRGLLKELRRSGEVDSGLNHALIDKATNARTGKRAPSAYLVGDPVGAGGGSGPRAGQPPPAGGREQPSRHRRLRRVPQLADRAPRRRARQ